MKFEIPWPARGHNFIPSDLNGLQDLLLSEAPMTNSSFVGQFERTFCSKFDLKNCLATMSCAHALDLIALYFRDLYGENAEIIIPAHTYCATAIAFGRAGLKVVWADIDETSKVISMETIKKVITKNTKAVVVVHLYGLIAPDICQIAEYCSSKGLALVEDCAQCIGVVHENQYVGAFGDFATFSFHAQKNMTTLGEGGMLSFNDPGLVEVFRGLRLNGHRGYERDIDQPYWLPALTDVCEDLKASWPIKSTMTEAQALVGLHLLDRLEAMNRKRKDDVMLFMNMMEGCPDFKFQPSLLAESHANHLLPIWVDTKRVSRDHVIKYLSSVAKIQAIIQYHPLHQYELFRKKINCATDLRVSETSYNSMISLPFWEGQTHEDLNKIAEHLKLGLRESML